MVRVAIAIAVALIASSGIAFADEVKAEYRLGSRRAHTEVPFYVDVVIDGMSPTTPPEQPPLEITGATVTAIGVFQAGSGGFDIVFNGRRLGGSQWIMRYRVLAAREGNLELPALDVVQGKLKATAGPRRLPVQTVPTTDDMKLILDPPNRPVFVGETVPIKLQWLLRADPEDWSFWVPLLNLDGLLVTAPPVPKGKRPIELAAGTKDLQAFLEGDTVTLNGAKYQRFSMSFLATPRSIPPGGKLEIPGASVIAALQVADQYGMVRLRQARATDVTRTLEVRPVPETDRPPSFAGAVGDQFSIDVRTSRSVVSLGEPVELTITVKSNQRLDALALGKLDGETRLPKDKFTVPSEAPTGVLSEDGKTKTFKVDVQVTGATNSIPAIAFSYFDPVKAAYRTIKSDEIALAVKGGTVVSAEDVVATRTPRGSGAAAVDDVASVKAELSLSSVGQAEAQPLGGAMLWVLVGFLYIVPLGVLGFRSWRLRTAAQREEAGEVRAARRRVEELLDRGDKSPARELAGPLAKAMRELARVIGNPDDQGMLEKLETEAFAPSAADKPLSADLRSDAAGLLRRWMTDARRRKAS
jgi:hypothetical protein